VFARLAKWELGTTRTGPADRAPLDRCAGLLGVDLATVRDLTLASSRISDQSAPKSGASSSLSGSSDPRRTASVRQLRALWLLRLMSRSLLRSWESDVALAFVADRPSASPRR
jgi:hypothetical protein